MKKILIVCFVILAAVFTYYKISTPKISKEVAALKLDWFIPDGVRADPKLFNMYKWAEEGKLPNIKKMMENGTYGYSKPVFPGHTPTNFATLLTGAYPEIHGVNDGQMHVIGKPLDKVAIAGFRSVAKKVAPIWKTMEDQGLKVSLLSIPGSTPPELNKGEVLRGRWGGWGADFFALVFESKKDLSERIKLGRAIRLFYFGAQLTNYFDNEKPQGWVNPPTSFSEPIEVKLLGWGTPIYGLIIDSTNDKTVNYNKVAFSLDKKSYYTLKQGDWGKWNPITLKWKSETDTLDIQSDYILNVIKLDSDGFLRIRVNYNNLNNQIAQPPSAADQMKKLAGPMIDFVDNFPAQLGYYPEDKKTFIEEMNMTFEWHKKAISAIVKSFAPNVIIHDIYSPTVMLCSKWWTGYIDPKSDKYGQVSDQDREKLWGEVKDMYLKLDEIAGEMMKNSNPNTYLVFSSDHGVMGQSYTVYLNNLFAKNGWLKFKINPETGEPIIDWKNSKVIYLKMAHVYINPNGLDGNYERASGPEYDKLRSEVIAALQNMTDEKGVKPVEKIVTWENVKKEFRLDPDRAGDLVIENKPDYAWSEEMGDDLKFFGPSMASGYKQALDTNNPEMWTPFIIVGPNVKKNNFLGNNPIDHIDQYPTIMKALNLKSPDFVQGKILDLFTTK